MLHENIGLPHRKHLYQIMANELKIPHVIVSLAYMTIQTLIIVGYIYCQRYGYIFLIGCILLLMYVILIFILLLVNVVDTKYLKVPTSTALYLEVRRDVGLGDAIHFIHEIGWNVRDIKEFPSGRPDILAVRMDLESDQALRGISPPWPCSKSRRASFDWKCSFPQNSLWHKPEAVLLFATILSVYLFFLRPKFPAGHRKNRRWETPDTPPESL